MARPIAWHLNLDAEYALAAGSLRYRPTEDLRRQVEAAGRNVPCLRPGDVRLGELPEGASAAAWMGRAWCPTEAALALLRSRGVPVPPAPDEAILRRVNHRDFWRVSGLSALPSVRVRSSSDLRTLSAQRLLLKRALSAAGRGKRPLRPADITAKDRAWIEKSAGLGGCLAEPWVDITAEYAVHGYLFPPGSGRPPHFGVICRQRMAHRAWVAAEPVAPDALDASQSQALMAAAAQVATCLEKAGYFGPFGVDAFVGQLEDGAFIFQPVSDVNARYTMGWWTGMGGFEVPEGLP